MLQSSTAKKRWTALICVSGSEMTANNSGPIFMTHHIGRDRCDCCKYVSLFYVTLCRYTAYHTGVGTFHRSFRLEYEAIVVCRCLEAYQADWCFCKWMDIQINDWLIVSWNFNIDALFYFDFRNEQLLLQWDPLYGGIDCSHEGTVSDVQVPKQNVDLRAESLSG